MEVVTLEAIFLKNDEGMQKVRMQKDIGGILRKLEKQVRFGRKVKGIMKER